MQPKQPQNCNLSKDQATSLQQILAKQVVTTDQFSEINLVAGVDVAYDKNSDKLIAAVAVLDAQTLELVEAASVEDQARFPYIPGLFSFRELPPISFALEELGKTPDLIVCDGHGLAHPRRFGLACHLGVIFDIPTIGCAKTRLVGEAKPPASQKGSIEHLMDEGETIGAVLRTQDNIRPVYVSIGHRISLESAYGWILRLSTRYRLPETTRFADQIVKARLGNKDLSIQ